MARAIITSLVLHAIIAISLIQTDNVIIEEDSALPSVPGFVRGFEIGDNPGPVRLSVEDLG